MPARITHVAIENYRSIGSCDVELQPLTLLVGPNGSGKSNFLDALRFLNQSMYSPLEQVISVRSGLYSLLRKLPNGKIAANFRITVGFTLTDESTGTYSLTVAEGPAHAAVILKESCDLAGEWFSFENRLIESSVKAVPATTGDRPLLAAFGALPQFAPAYELIAGFMFYAPDVQWMRRPAPVGPGSVLTSNASNAADVLFRLYATDRELAERVQRYLQSFNPEFAAITSFEHKNYRWLGFVPAGNPTHWKLDGADVSDGTLRAVAVLLAIFQTPATPFPLSLIGLEEPENNLHPAAAGILLDALLEARHRTPIIASTHSADLLDRKDLPENSILAFALQDGETVIGPVDAAGKEILHKRLYTAGELLRGNQLNPALPPQRS